MVIIGQMSSKEEANEIMFIAKVFVVACRARQLGKLISCGV
jgi:hypothetical protein